MNIFPSPLVAYVSHCVTFLCLFGLVWTFRSNIVRLFDTGQGQGVDTRAGRELMIAGLCAFGIVTFLLAGIGLPAWVSLLGGVLAAFGAPVYLRRRRKAKFIQEFDQALAESLQTVASSLKAGLTLRDSLRVASDNCAPVFAHEVSYALKEYRFGTPITEALDHIRKRVGTPNASIAFGAMIISSQIGGRLPLMLQKIVGTIRERQRVEGKLKALTAQGRAQAFLLCAAPPALGFGMYLYDPAKMSLMTDFWVGQILLVTAIVLEIIGIAAMIKVMKLEV